MAQVDPNIALSVVPPKIETGMNQLAMMEGAMKVGELQRSIGSQNMLRDLFSKGVDISSPEGFKQVASIDPAVAIKLRKDALEGRKTLADINTSEYKLNRDKTNNAILGIASFDSPQEALADINRRVQTGELAPEIGQQHAAKIQSTPWKQYKASTIQSLLTAHERSSAELTKRGQDITDARAREGQRLQYDPVVQGEIAKGRKLGEAAAEGVIAPIKDARANLKALRTAGYDPLTGTDTVSDLIKKSTSGAIETGLAGTYGAMPGAGTTSGQEAIGKLASISKTLTLDLLDGKLGAGISNDDRTALEQRFGDMANSMIPSDKRLAAWGEAKEIMRKAAMLPEPNNATPAATPSGGNNTPRKSLNDIFK
jgi:hypothetical protein